jgi:hypothetical protein
MSSRRSLSSAAKAFGRRALLPPAKGLLGAVEKQLLAAWKPERGAGERYPPIFIIGAPRTGTTLFYQVLIDRYKFGYFSNFMAAFPLAPAIAAWWQRTASSRPAPRPEYTSDRGRTDGPHGPNEAGAFWYRWFPRGDNIYVPPGATPAASLAELRREVAGMSRIFRSSVVFKNVYNSMRIAPLTEATPEASFVVCRRNPLDTAQSILKNRVQTYQAKDRWWSLPPREFSEIRRHPYWEQVAEQVFYTYEQISRDAQALGADRFYDVHYEELCRDVHGTLAGLERFLDQRNVEARIRGEVPRQFTVSSGPQVDPEDYDRMDRKVRELWT